jgi:hypothetical protein
MNDSLGPHMQVRLSEHVVAAYQGRLQLWHQTFQRDLDAAIRAGGREVGATLVEARRRVGPLHNLATSPLLYEDLKRLLLEDLEADLRSTQESLEKEARKDPRVERLLLGVLRQVDLLAGLAPVQGLPQPAPSSAPDGDGTTEGRRVIVTPGLGKS